MNLTIITSVINISKEPLSYSGTRSIYSPEERFNQTIKTIESLKKINNTEILFIESTNITKEMENFLKSKVTYFLNIDETTSKSNSPHKASAESSQIYEGLKNVDISKYENIFKISGRYWLTDEFDFKLFDNESNVFYESKNNSEAIATAFYKVNKDYFDLYQKTLDYCRNSTNMLEMEFKKLFNGKYKNINNLGLVGNVSVDGFFWDGKSV